MSAKTYLMFISLLYSSKYTTPYLQSILLPKPGEPYVVSDYDNMKPNVKSGSDLRNAPDNDKLGVTIHPSYPIRASILDDRILLKVDWGNYFKVKQGMSSTWKCKNYTKTFKCVRICMDLNYDYVMMDEDCQCRCFYSVEEQKHPLFRPNFTRDSWRMLPETSRMPNEYYTTPVINASDQERQIELPQAINNTITSNITVYNITSNNITNIVSSTNDTYPHKLPRKEDTATISSEAEPHRDGVTIHNIYPIRAKIVDDKIVVKADWSNYIKSKQGHSSTWRCRNFVKTARCVRICMDLNYDYAIMNYDCECRCFYSKIGNKFAEFRPKVTRDSWKRMPVINKLPNEHQYNIILTKVTATTRSRPLFKPYQQIYQVNVTELTDEEYHDIINRPPRTTEQINAAYTFRPYEDIYQVNITELSDEMYDRKAEITINPTQIFNPTMKTVSNNNNVSNNKNKDQ